MNRLLIAACFVALALSPLNANDQRARVLMQAAEAKAKVEGDLSGAIKLYKDAEKEAGSNRTLVAQALVKMAEAYQELGDAEAQKIYQRLVRDFSDQKDPVAIARGRLGPLSSSPNAMAVKGDRAVWTGPEVDLFGTVSPDGRFLSYVDWGRGSNNLMVRDLLTQTSRALTDNTSEKRTGTADFSVISRDGTQVAYWWSTQPAGEFRIARLQTPGNHQTRVLRTAGYVRAFDWSPDDRFIAALLGDNRIGIVSVTDGSVRQLKSVDWNGVGKIVFSPDGRHIAYDLASAERVGRRDIRIMAVDGTSETVVVADAFRNHIMAWSSAGHLVYSSDRTGTRSLWTVRIDDGHVAGEPRLAKENVRSTMSLGLTSTGTLYVWQPASPSYVGVEPVGPTGGLSNGRDGSFQQFIESRGWPRWSPDGKRLLFISCGLTGGGPCALFVRDGQGTPREVPHGMWYMFPPEFSPDGEKIIARGSDLKDRSGIFVIDVTTGATSMLIPHEAGSALQYPRNATWSRDGRAVFYVATDGEDFVVLRRDISAAGSTEVFRTSGRGISWISVSPDDRHVAVIQHSPGNFLNQPGTLFVTPVSGGTSRAVFTAAGLDAEQWAADGQSVFAHKHTADGFEVWRVPLSGMPVKLEIEGTSRRGLFQFSPDGKYVAFTGQAGEAGDQIWAIENFLPALK